MEGLFVAECLLDMSQSWLSTLTNALWSTCCDGERKLHISSSKSTDAFVSVPAMSQQRVGRLCMVVEISVCVHSLFVTEQESPPPQRHKRQRNVT